VIGVSFEAMKALTFTLVAFGFALASCGRSPGTAPNPHDSKYVLLESGGDTCVVDTLTGLTWELKSAEPGLHAAENTYTWFDPDEAHGELDYRGTEDGGSCSASACDTWHFALAVNDSGYCGFADWRMPLKNELLSISDLSRLRTPPTINTRMFPNTRSAEYWSGNDYSFQYDSAWAWNFELGHDRVDWKRSAKFVRLVRGTAGALPEVKE